MAISTLPSTPTILYDPFTQPGGGLLTAPGWEAGPVQVATDQQNMQFSENLLAVLANGNIVVSSFEVLENDGDGSVSWTHYLNVLTPGGAVITRNPFLYYNNSMFSAPPAIDVPVEVIPLPDGGFAAVWVREGIADPHHITFVLQAFDADGTARGAATQIYGDNRANRDPFFAGGGGVHLGDVEALDNGHIAIVRSDFQSVYGPFFNNYDLGVVVTNSLGAPLGQFNIETGAASASSGNKIAAAGSGQFLVVWSESSLEGGTFGYAQLFDATGAVGAKNPLAENTNGAFDVTRLADGSFVVVRNGGAQGMSLELLDSTGASTGPVAFPFPEDSRSRGVDAEVTALEDGGFAVGWTIQGTIYGGSDPSLDHQTLVQVFDALGQHIGYLPQDVELFDGTIAENIARFTQAEPNDIVAAARLAGVDEMIRALPGGYDTRIGVGGATLSGGQRQRIGLARAVFGDPKLIVLDEPNANLDVQGEMALRDACLRLKERGVTLVIVSHRPNIANVADKLLVLENGTQKLYGPAAAVSKKLAEESMQANQARVVRKPSSAA